MSNAPEPQWKAPDSDLLPPTEKIPLSVQLTSALILVVGATFPFYGEVLLGESSLLIIAREQPGVLLLVGWSWCTGMMLLCHYDNLRFLQRFPAIETLPALHALATLARQNMLLALLQMAMLLVAVTGAVMTVVAHGMIGGIVVGVLTWLFSLVSRICFQSETQLRALPVASHLESRYQRICHSWVHDALPRFD